MLNPERVPLAANPFRVNRRSNGPKPMVVAALQPWAAISERLRRILYKLQLESLVRQAKLGVSDWVKFTVAPGGKFDNGIAISNQLGSDRVIVPVQIIGEQDGTWNKTAWQTEAFYGNPLKGFTALP